MMNIQVINCKTIYSLISIYDSSNLAFLTSNFTNNTGRVFSCKNCIMAVIGNVIINNVCNFQNEIEACFLYASDGSQLAVNFTVCYNILNIKEGGSIYIIDSLLFLYGFQLMGSVSDNFGGCIMSSSSTLIALNSVFSNYLGGCLYLESSNLTLVSTKFTNELFKNKVTSYGSTVVCLNCESSTIVACSFVGNYNNTAMGGVELRINSIFFNFFYLGFVL